MASGQTLPTLKEAFIKLNLGRCQLTSWVFIANIMDEFILRPDVMHAHDASMELRCHVVHLGIEKVLLQHPRV
jgi:hypothetical protein